MVLPVEVLREVVRLLAALDQSGTDTLVLQLLLVQLAPLPPPLASQSYLSWQMAPRSSSRTSRLM